VQGIDIIDAEIDEPIMSAQFERPQGGKAMPQYYPRTIPLDQPTFCRFLPRNAKNQNAGE
jgi:hypothetical protein